MWFGVRHPTAVAETQAKRQPLTILGDLVHNESVLARLRSQGVRIEHQVADLTTPTVMITAMTASENTDTRCALTALTFSSCMACSLQYC